MNTTTKCSHPLGSRIIADEGAESEDMEFFSQTVSLNNNSSHTYKAYQHDSPVKIGRYQQKCQTLCYKVHMISPLNKER